MKNWMLALALVIGSLSAASSTGDKQSSDTDCVPGHEEGHEAGHEAEEGKGPEPVK